MKKYKMIALSALIAVGFTSCELDEKPTSYYEKDAYFQTYNHAKMAVVGIYDCLAIDKHYMISKKSGRIVWCVPLRL